MRTNEYQYDINSLIMKDEAGVISSFALQLDSILADNEPLNETGMKVLDETLKLLHELATPEFTKGYADLENDLSLVY